MDIKAEREIFLQGFLQIKRREVEALDVKCGRLQIELLRLIKPFEPIEPQIKVIDVESIEQAVKELKEIKILYKDKAREIERIEKELGIKS